MTTAPRGRKTKGLHRTPVEGRPRTTAQGLSAALRRPLVSAAAILAVAGVCAARTSEPAPAGAEMSRTASPLAVSEATGFTYSRDDTDDALAAARDLSARRAPVVVRDRLASAHALRMARARAAAALTRSRVVAAERVSRAQVRQSLVDRAQSDPRAIGRLMVADRGWGSEQFECLDSLWTKESGWSWAANNSGSGAYGIPQALPGSKMSSSGGDWATNPITQISWGLRYVERSYGTPCSAWAHSQTMNWY